MLYFGQRVNLFIVCELESLIQCIIISFPSDCEQDKTLYVALNLQAVVNISDVLDIEVPTPV